jgi:transcriptional regulator with XRE-family HTH domain
MAAANKKSYREAAARRFGENLVLWRRRGQLSQDELALRAELNRSEISKLEHGQRVPRIDTLIKLAFSLDGLPGDLLEGLAWVPAHRQPGGQFIARRRGVEPGNG